MPDLPIIQTRDANGIDHLFLNQPDRHNALSPDMIAALLAAFTKLGDDPSCRLICLRATKAAATSFCAGGDLVWMRQQIDAPRSQRMAAAAKLAHLLKVMDRFPRPLLGCVDGNAFGGGIGIMAVCDEVLASDGLRFGLTETRLGLIPATISPYVVARIGAPAARQLFMSARRFDSATAKRVGLITKPVPAVNFTAEIDAMIAPYLDASPAAMQAAKNLIRKLQPAIDDAVIDMTITALADCWDHSDAREGVMRFLPAARHHGNQIALANKSGWLRREIMFCEKMLGFCKKTFHCDGSICLQPYLAWYAMPAAAKYHHLGVL